MFVNGFMGFLWELSSHDTLGIWILVTRDKHTDMGTHKDTVSIILPIREL